MWRSKDAEAWRRDWDWRRGKTPGERHAATAPEGSANRMLAFLFAAGAAKGWSLTDRAAPGRIVDTHREAIDENNARGLVLLEDGTVWEVQVRRVPPSG